MPACYGCCVACKPRYKVLVDNIFPVNPQDGLVKNNMEKLTFYALSSPEKLDRIGDYLAKRLSHDVHRHKIPFVFIAMEALDQLLVACHAQTLNLFVESFLRMVQKLLECDEPDLQCMATSSFVKFSNIEEDTPSYHRRYDFFVSKFSSMCHSNLDNEDDRTRIRVAGLRGLQGVVRKTVSDDLQVNIWEHMDKIVPSLLYNIQSHSREVESPGGEEHPSVVAETCVRDLICRASFGNINSILQPALNHLDNHGLWVPNEFAVKCFKMVMYSVQAQFGYLVVQILMSHLDDHSHSEAKVKASIVDVLGETVLIAAGGSIGPSVLEVFNTLLRHLKNSVNSMTINEQSLNEEKRFQESIINTIGEFANHLPDYQKIEILMFVMGKVPMPSDDDNLSDSSDVLLQTMLLKTLLKVATKYKTVVYSNAFPPAFLEPLLRIATVNDSGIRLIVQKILHTLLDRHDNSVEIQHVRIPKDIAQLDLTVELPPRQDIMFLKKHGMQIYWHLYENMQMFNNKSENFEALYCTLALLSIECGGEEILVDLIRLALGIQQVVQNKTDLPLTHKCAVHSVVAAYLNLISQLTAIPAFCQHCTKVIQSREIEAGYLLPDQAFNRTNTIKSYPSSSDSIKEHLLFNKNSIAEALKNAGFDTTKLDTPFAARPSGIGIDMVDRAYSANDIHSISLEVDSVHSSPGLGGRRISIISRKFSVDLRHPEEEITFESMKKILAQSDEKLKQEEEERRLYILDTFRNAPFEEIMARSEAKNKLDDILSAIAQESDNSAEKTPLMTKYEDNSNEPSFEMQFPDLFVY
ncbi:protein EFR3 homolog A-like [Tubulanus polymorphus]|uniref:protein EFR3 homolog A-like n=1 Tax=Tubulanus polymorphus TaxID=672921 RepID=UPI003DA22523